MRPLNWTVAGGRIDRRWRVFEGKSTARHRACSNEFKCQVAQELLGGRTVTILDRLTITELIARARWREAVTYRKTWPHEYVLSRKDGQRELIEAVRARFRAGKGVAGSFFGRRKHLPVHRRPQVLAHDPLGRGGTLTTNRTTC